MLVHVLEERRTEMVMKMDRRLMSIIMDSQSCLATLVMQLTLVVEEEEEEDKREDQEVEDHQLDHKELLLAQMAI